MKKTPWYPGTVKPVRAGVYEKRVARPGRYQHWNGCWWGGWASTVDGAATATSIDHMSQDQHSDWCGLTEKEK